MLSFCYKNIILFKNKTLLVLLSYLPFCNNNVFKKLYYDELKSSASFVATYDTFYYDIQKSF